MEDKFIVAELAKRRMILAGEIVRMQAELRQMVTNLQTLDAAIRVLDADYPIETLQPKGLRMTGDWANRGEQVRLIFDILRNASKPLSAVEIAREVMLLKQMDANNKKVLSCRKTRIAASMCDRSSFNLSASVSQARSLPDNSRYFETSAVRT
jgi:hypothetical protein